MKFTVRILLLIFFFFHVQASTIAQDSAKMNKRWQWLVEPYMMFPNMKGNCSIGNLPDVKVDASPDDLFSNLKIGAMLYAEVRNNKWAISADIMYMKLEENAKASALINSGKVTAEQLGFEIATLRRMLQILDGGIGVRFNSIQSSVNIIQNNIGGGTTVRNKELTKNWVDPILITRITFPVKNKWLLNLRGDIGGFGVGSDLVWQLQANTGYRFSNLFQVQLGYRIISMKYETGDEDSRFLYDMDTFGPVLRLGFNF